jgi:phospholipase C
MMLLLVFEVVSRMANAASFSDVKHIVIILKENHNFDNYFGLFPRADAIVPAKVLVGEFREGFPLRQILAIRRE